MSRRPRYVPVIMYHSVRDMRSGTWAYRHLTLELEYFRAQLEYFRRHRYSVVSLDEVAAFKRGDQDLPARSVCLTFDDGYLDNWVFAFPLLARYGYRATVFVATDFVDPREGCRPTLEAVFSGEVSRSELEVNGFMSWDELRAAESTGVVDAQSHTATHTFLPCEATIADYHHPGDDLPWLDWNARPAQKPYYMAENAAGVSTEFGAPVYEARPALIARLLTESGGLTSHLKTVVAQQGGASFFGDPEWRRRLAAEANSYRQTNSVTFAAELEDDYRRRVVAELVSSKAAIEAKLRKFVRHVCWPNGGWSDDTHAWALSVGYETSTAKGSPNEYGSADPTRILRTGLHQVGSRRIVSRAFVHYALNAHRNVSPYVELRMALARSGAASWVKKVAYR